MSSQIINNAQYCFTAPSKVIFDDQCIPSGAGFLAKAALKNY